MSRLGRRVAKIEAALGASEDPDELVEDVPSAESIEALVPPS